MRYILAIDQGTTSTRTILFGPEGAPVSTAQQEFTQIYPHPGWIEHDPNDVWQTTLTTMSVALAKAKLRPNDIAAIGHSQSARDHTYLESRNRRADLQCHRLAGSSNGRSLRSSGRGRLRRDGH